MARPIQPSSAAHRYDGLPFVDPGTPGEGRDFWAPRSTGDYDFDCTLGEVYADAVLPMLREPDGMFLLRHIVMAIADHADKKRDHGVLVGMFGKIGRALERPAGLQLVHARPVKAVA